MTAGLVGIGSISDLIYHGDKSQSTPSLSSAILTCQCCQRRSPCYHICNPSPVGPPLGTRPSPGLNIAVYRVISPSFVCSLISFLVLDLLLFLLAVPQVPLFLSRQTPNVTSPFLTLHVVLHLRILFIRCSQSRHRILCI